MSTRVKVPVPWGSDVVVLSTTSVLGKCVCLVTLAMSLFDLQDVCIAMGSLATLDLPMVVDLIGIYGLKGPYSTLTTTDWFLQALSVIPRGSWGDVARRFTMIRWADQKAHAASLLTLTPPPPSPPRAAAVAAPLSPETCFRQLFEENPIVLISSGLLVQSDEGVSDLVVDRIDVTTAINREAPGS
ncbi:DNA-directed RNA polymerase V subunit 1 [Dorcoceras hygrometricum]|uniref:DNA-directed RNA polymerase V subunit 1 n=1 Tax=Dorcoceras hygrometricum TaxID=472368 RepID=A0A2Z7BVH5_9LAMI|nr:DNA-directed RNA polymerase V subunit 1 [Dorcoceras hygrometricum]